MKNLFSSLAVIIIVLNLSFDRAFGNDAIMLGLQTGVKDVQGRYNNQLENGYYIGIYSILPIPIINKYLTGDINLSYTRYVLKESKSSNLISSSFKAGPLVYYPLFKYFQPYAGLTFGINYLHLTTENTNTSEKTFKPASSVKTGFFVPFGRYIKARITAEYSLFELSKERFQDIKYGLGVAYNFRIYDEDNITKLEKTLEYERLYDDAIDLFKAGDGRRARDIFEKIIEYDSDFKDVDNYLEIIHNNEDKYEQALELVDDGKLYDAVTILAETEKYFIEARDKLRKVRLILLKEVRNHESQAIMAYDNKEYRKCILILQKIQSVDPENKVVEVYFPKAVQRYNAIKRFE